VFLNVLVNAIQAIEGEGEIRIRTWLEGGAIHTAISDTGKGIPPELRSKIFESGFTTKSEEGGSGLGLFICRRIVHQHGGRIDVESFPGNGATFFIVLPTHQANERKAND
jgi:signal transduction histidine kinase